MEDEEKNNKILDKFVEHMTREYLPKFNLVVNKSEESNLLILDFDVMMLGDYDASLMIFLLNNASKALEIIEKALQIIQDKFFELNSNDLITSNSNLSKLNPNKELCVQLKNIPLFPSSKVVHIPSPDMQVDRLLVLNVNVLRVSDKKMLEKERLFKCAKCSLTFAQVSPEDQYNVKFKPKKCPSNSCNSVDFVISDAEFRERTMDYQEIKIQERLHELGVRKVPRTATVILQNNLVSSVEPGDQIYLVGIMKSRLRSLMRNKEVGSANFIKANAITFLDKSRSNETPIFEEHFNEFTDYWKLNQNSLIQARDAILAEVCPKIYGMYPLKLALMLQIIGGSQKRDEEAKIRGDIHMLLVGDPGTGKSQFLKFVHSICPNSVLTTGFGSTSAGLTAAASRDGGNWHLDAGALVLADKSICCIDEFSCIKESDKIQIHEAMEQQTISIAKAGMVNTLHTRCSILAATNPKGRYDPLSPLNINIALESPLISRFDVIMILLDNSNDKCDSGIADHIIGYHKQDLNKNNNFSTIISEEATWTPDLLKQYISCVKTLKPILSADAKDLLLKYYSFQRETDSSSNLRTTVRLLESLIRLSTAHAKLMFRDTVTLDDAVEAIFITEYSIRSCCIFSDRLLACQKDFPIDPDEEFEKRKETIISILLQDSENTEPVYHNKNNSLFSKIV